MINKVKMFFVRIFRSSPAIIDEKGIQEKLNKALSDVLLLKSEIGESKRRIEDLEQENEHLKKQNIARTLKKQRRFLKKKPTRPASFSSLNEIPQNTDDEMFETLECVEFDRTMTVKVIRDKVTDVQYIWMSSDGNSSITPRLI